MMALSALRAFLFATLAWLVGLALAVVVGFALGLSLPGPAGIVGGGLVLGATVGLAQRRVMRLPGLRLVVVTSLATPLAFLAAACVGAALRIPGLTALAGPLVLLAQATLSRGEAYRPQMSGGILAAGLGWAVAVAGLVVPGLPIGARIGALVVPGMMAAIYVTRPSLARFPAGFLHFASAQQRKPVE